PSGARVRCGLGVRDHEEGEDEESAAFEAMHRNRERLPEPERTTEEEPDVAPDERKSHVAARRAVDDEAPHADEEKTDESGITPLSGRDPNGSCGEHHGNDPEVGGIEEMLAVPAEKELGSDGGDGGRDRERRRVGPEQETEGEPGDRGAPGIED